MNNTATPHAGLSRSTLLNLSGMLVPVAVQLLTVPFYIRLIGTDRYGVMALVWLMLGYFGVFDFGFGRAMASRIAGLAQAPAQRREIFWTGTCLSILTGAAGGVLLYVAAGHLFGNVFMVPSALLQETRMALPFVALALPLITVISALSGTLQGYEAFGAMNFSQMTGSILYQIFPLLLALTVSPSLPGLVIAAITGRLVTALMLFGFCLSHLQAQMRPMVKFAQIKPLLSYGGWISITGLISPLLTVFDRFVLGTMSGMQAVTAYTIPFNLVMRIGALPASLQNALFPRFAAVDAVEAKKLLDDGVKIIAALMTPVLMTSVLLIQPFLHFWIGGSLAAASGVVGQILILGLWPNMLAFIPFSFLQSRNRPDLPAKFHLAELIVYAPALYFLIHYFGAQGAAAAWGARTFLDTILLFTAVQMLPSLLVCVPGLLALSLACISARIAMPLPAYIAASTGLLGICAVWSVRILPVEIKRALAARGAIWRLRMVPP